MVWEGNQVILPTTLYHIRISYPMEYIQIDLSTSDPQLQEVLLAELTELGWESFAEGPDALQAFLPAKEFTQVRRFQVDQLADRFGLTWTQREWPAQNWNALWESNFSPIRVSDFCGIRADFHAPMEGVRHELIINPRMAFGTGHHETTHLMIQLMAGLNLRDRKVLDYGCGTGVLALLAARLGGNPIDAVDIERAAYENTLENAQRNDVHSIRVVHGTLESVVDHGYAVVLANINRQVILDTLPALRKKMQKDGVLLVSGILEQDGAMVLEAAAHSGFAPTIQEQRGNWLALQFVRQ